ncbi:hypothetical protein BDU57DRAFT_519175 [Ampelomyces quisqualis]|uniref:Uncharacterized protein n=1 Tax=Ampelomyces quisqualis TaxID=50730 RepID=A0A6A5QFG3_AMPQU|nr:hypothetical protein BDU57DRAFT_519175 [Ampelomyces quisqualis]
MYHHPLSFFFFLHTIKVLLPSVFPRLLLSMYPIGFFSLSLTLVSSLQAPSRLIL